MNWFARNVLLVHLAAYVMVLSWIHGGTRSDLLAPVIPWLTLLMFEWLLVFPQAKTTETLTESRRRVWRALARDPLLYVALVLTLLLLIPLANVAMPPMIDSTTQKWVIAKPPVAWLPYCVNPDHHAVLLLWFPPALVAALSAKHGLLKKSKRWLLELICWNGAALALTGFLQLGCATKKLLWVTPMSSHFFSVFGYPNFAGAFFTLIAAISFGLWFHHVTERAGLAPYASPPEEDESLALLAHRMLIPALLSFLGAVASLSRAGILLSALVFAVMIGYMLVYLWSRVTAGTRVTLVSIVGAIMLSVVAVLLVFKLDSLKGEIRTITPAAIWSRVSGSGYYHARIAKEIFRDHPVFGVGGWGYPRYVQVYLTKDEEKRLQIDGGANVHNDSLQFLAEQGVAGYGLLVAAALLLTLPLCWHAWLLCRSQKSSASSDEPGTKTWWLHRIPAPLVAVWVGTGATVCHSLGDLPFRAPSILAVWVLALICVAGWLPVIRETPRR